MKRKDQIRCEAQRGGVGKECGWVFLAGAGRDGELFRGSMTPDEARRLAASLVGAANDVEKQDK